MTCAHTIQDHTWHHGWNNTNVPVITIKPDETVEFRTQDAKLDFGKVNPVTGPVYKQRTSQSTN